MQLFLTDTHKQHLEIITKQSTSVFQDICKIALDFIKSGPNTKAILGVAQAIDVPPQNLRQAVEGLVKLLIESHKNKLDEQNFSSSVETLGFAEEQKNILTKLYIDESKWFGVVSTLPVPPHYHNLEWRFEVQVASRSLLHQLTPLVTMRMYLKDEEHATTEKKRHDLPSSGENQMPDLKCHNLQIDPVCLLHITGVLEEALAEGNSRHCRRIQHSLE